MGENATWFQEQDCLSQLFIEPSLPLERQPTPTFSPGESQGRGRAWWAAVYGVAQSRTRLKRLKQQQPFSRPDVPTLARIP